MMGRLLWASLRRRGRQFLLIGLAVAVAAATVAALVGFVVRAEGGFGEELAAFGPNLTVRPQVGGALELPAGAVAAIRELPGVESAEGAAGGGAALTQVDVRARPDRLDAVAAAVEARLPGAEARPLLRVSRAERDLVRRVTWLLGAAALLTCLLALVSVGAATTALVVERRREVGLLIALGFTGRRVSALFAAELLTAALLAAVAGQVAGEAAAGRLAAGLLGRAAAVSAASVGWALPAAALAAVAVVAAAMTLALRRVESVDPAAVLRGE
jgi:predicted lysophospholipase L1 biosynthesis ABC-type transport system permease subunit